MLLKAAECDARHNSTLRSYDLGKIAAGLGIHNIAKGNAVDLVICFYQQVFFVGLWGGSGGCGGLVQPFKGFVTATIKRSSEKGFSR